MFGLPEEPLKNAAVPRMTVAENIAFRTFDKPPIATLGWWLSPGPMRAQGARADRALPGQDAVDRDADREPLRRQRAARGAGARAVRRRRRADRRQPCFGLDFASVAEIRAQIMEQRNRGAAVLLVSEDLDEILELADRIAVMSGGTINYVAPVGETDRTTIGQHMAGH